MPYRLFAIIGYIFHYGRYLLLGAVIAAIMILVAGCAPNLYLKFDSQELQNFVEVKAEADVARTYCHSDPTRALEVALTIMPRKVAIAESYVAARGTTEVRSAAKILRELADELRAAYARGPVSSAYCDVKYGNISAAAGRIAATISRKD